MADRAGDRARDRVGDVMGNQSTRRNRATVGITGACLAFAVVLLAPFSTRASITGVCPDGSIFIVQRVISVPCRDAKVVDPSDIPPLKPEFLPRPYGWEVFNRRNDPNNPYNLIHTAPMDAPVVERQRREEVRTERVPVRSEFVPERTPDVSAPAVSAVDARMTRSAGTAAPLALANREIRDLVMIVDLSQRRAPAALMARGSGGRVQLAMSRAFESRLRQQFAARGRVADGRIVLFSADTQVAGSFHGNLTFVQGHVAYQPDSSNPFQLGLISGSMGELGVDEPVLGYVVLPENMNLAQPLDIYWNDLQITATLTP